MTWPSLEQFNNFIDEQKERRGIMQYQCGSCEKMFSKLMMDTCPHCGSGNWVIGQIDDDRPSMIRRKVMQIIGELKFNAMPSHKAVTELMVLIRLNLSKAYDDGFLDSKECLELLKDLYGKSYSTNDGNFRIDITNELKEKVERAIN